MHQYFYNFQKSDVCASRLSYSREDWNILTVTGHLSRDTETGLRPPSQNLGMFFIVIAGPRHTHTHGEGILSLGESYVRPLILLNIQFKNWLLCEFSICLLLIFETGTEPPL